MIGNGRKERLVPLSPRARATVDAYLRDVRPSLAQRSRRPTDALFMSKNGRPLDRARIWQVVRVA